MERKIAIFWVFHDEVWGYCMEDENQNIRIGVYTNKEILELCDSCLKDAGCESRSEFINKAIKIYASFLTSKRIEDYLLNTVLNVFNATIKDSENRMARMYFKIAVELAKLNNVIASNNNISEEEMNKLQLKCLDEVKRINGTITFEEAYDFQNDLN